MATFDALIEFGIDADTAALAVAATAPHSNVDACLEWIFASKEATAGAGADEETDSSDADEEPQLKLVIVVRSQLQMSAGKVAAQCVHAALANYRVACYRNEPGARRWVDTGEKTVVVAAPADAGADWFADRLATARAQGLVAEAVADAGRTEVDPGSITCLAVGPDVDAKVNKITGDLSLFR